MTTPTIDLAALASLMVAVCALPFVVVVVLGGGRWIFTTISKSCPAAYAAPSISRKNRSPNGCRLIGQ